MIDDKAIRPKVKAGLIGGVSISVIMAVITAVIAEDYATALQVFGVSIVPVIISFGLAWLKVDPQMVTLINRYREEFNLPPTTKGE